MPIRHTTVATGADDPDAEINKAEWNADHTNPDIADVTGLQAALDAKVAGNSAITGATKTKVTYDAKGLVTAGADATTADIADSADKRYVTDAQLTVIQNTSGTNTGDQTNITGNAGTVTTINGRIAAGTNVTITGSGTAASPYTISASASGGGSGESFAVVDYLTIAALPANTYDNGASGVGATLTGDANGALAISTVFGEAAPSLNEVILVAQEASGQNNGVYTVTQVGDASNPYILTRHTSFDSASELSANTAFRVTNGSAAFSLLGVDIVTTVGTDAVTFYDNSIYSSVPEDSNNYLITSASGNDGWGQQVTTIIANAGDISAVGSITFNGAGSEINDIDTISFLEDSGSGFNIGASGTIMNPLGKAYINTTAVGNVGGGTDDLMEYDLPADSLSIDGRGVRITAMGQTANNGNAKTLTLAFGSTTIFSASLATSVNNRWSIVAEVVRTGSNAQDYFIIVAREGVTLLPAAANGTSAQTDSSDITIKCTGAGTANNDIVQEFMKVEFFN